VQLLLYSAAYERLSREIAEIAPGLDIVTMTPSGAFTRAGQTLPDHEVKADIVFFSSDATKMELFSALMKQMLRGPTQWAALLNAGLDRAEYREAFTKGIRLTKGVAQAVPIAEFVLGYGLSRLLPMDRLAAQQARKEWRVFSFREIGQSHWVLVGFGAIGTQIAQRLKPFGARLTVVRRTPVPSPPADAVVAQADLLRVLPDADVVVFACPLSPETRGMANDAFFAALKKEAVLINIGRGELIVDDALRQGLERDQPGYAVLDVTDPEPLPATHWAWEHPKVRVTPHTSSFGRGNPARSDRAFLENLRRFMTGMLLLNEAGPYDVGL
jgi:phosphoglycerate dehydrogenase-like enzyme